MRLRHHPWLLVVVALVVSGCAGQEGSAAKGCGWPADPSRYGVLYHSYEKDEVVAVDPQSGEVRARCEVPDTLVTASAIPLRTPGGRYRDSRLVAGSEVMTRFDPELRSIATADGVLELANSQLTKIGSDKWTPVALPGNGAVLLARRPPERSDRASDWCLLPTRDTPVGRCRPISTSQAPGTPAVHDDGTVGWATEFAVPARLGNHRGWAQTDGKRLVRLELLPPTRQAGPSHTRIDLTGRSGWIAPEDMANLLGERVSRPESKRITWFRAIGVGSRGVTGELVRTPLTMAKLSFELDALNQGDPGRLSGVRVAPDGKSVVVALRPRPDKPVLVQIKADGTHRVLASLPADLDPAIVYWPSPG